MINRANLKQMSKSRLVVLLLEQDEQLFAFRKEIDVFKLSQAKARDAAAESLERLQAAHIRAEKALVEDLEAQRKANIRHKAKLAEKDAEIRDLKAEIARLDTIAARVIVKEIHAEFGPKKHKAVS